MNATCLIPEEKRPAALATLNQAVFCTLAAIDGKGSYILPVSYGYEGDSLYFHSGNHGHKLDVFEDGKLISFSILTDVAPVVGLENPCAFSTHYHSIRGQGRIRRLTDAGEMQSGLDVIVRHYAGTPIDYPIAQTSRIVVYRITIEAMSYKEH